MRGASRCRYRCDAAGAACCCRWRTRCSFRARRSASLMRCSDVGRWWILVRNAAWRRTSSCVTVDPVAQGRRRLPGTGCCRVSRSRTPCASGSTSQAAAAPAGSSAASTGVRWTVGSRSARVRQTGSARASPAYSGWPRNPVVPFVAALSQRRWRNRCAGRAGNIERIRELHMVWCPENACVIPDQPTAWARLGIRSQLPQDNGR